ncbi:MAG TPA: AAA family ATPase, partial [Negativicutes bacterium]|nr:AAA family ATPase [Negativicutes bacterium]
MTQDQALYILESGQNVYLTGAAGSGKTYVLNKFISELKKRKVGVGVTASTGIAATHLGGITIHSWAGMGIARDASKEQIQNIIEKRHVA